MVKNETSVVAAAPVAKVTLSSCSRTRVYSSCFFRHLLLVFHFVDCFSLCSVFRCSFFVRTCFSPIFSPSFLRFVFFGVELVLSLCDLFFVDKSSGLNFSSKKWRHNLTSILFSPDRLPKSYTPQKIDANLPVFG